VRSYGGRTDSPCRHRLFTRGVRGIGVLGNSGASLVLFRILCHGAHTSPSVKSMLPSLRGQLTPREGAGQLPVLLLDLGQLPFQRPVNRQERLAGS
jgi:hypothetical protein